MAYGELGAVMFKVLASEARLPETEVMNKEVSRPKRKSLMKKVVRLFTGGKKKVVSDDSGKSPAKLFLNPMAVKEAYDSVCGWLETNKHETDFSLGEFIDGYVLYRMYELTQLREKEAQRKLASGSDSPEALATDWPVAEPKGVTIAEVEVTEGLLSRFNADYIMYLKFVYAMHGDSSLKSNRSPRNVMSLVQWLAEDKPTTDKEVDPGFSEAEKLLLTLGIKASGPLDYEILDKETGENLEVSLDGSRLEVSVCEGSDSEDSDIKNESPVGTKDFCFTDFVNASEKSAAEAPVLKLDSNGSDIDLDEALSDEDSPVDFSPRANSEEEDLDSSVEL